TPWISRAFVTAGADPSKLRLIPWDPMLFTVPNLPSAWPLTSTGVFVASIPSKYEGPIPLLTRASPYGSCWVRSIGPGVEGGWLGVVRAADREVVRAGGSRVRALGGGPGRGRRIVEIGGDGATGHGGWQHAGRQRMAVRRHPVDTAGGEHDGSDADGHPVFPGGAQQTTRGR